MIRVKDFGPVSTQRHPLAVVEALSEMTGVEMSRTTIGNHPIVCLVAVEGSNEEEKIVNAFARLGLPLPTATIREVWGWDELDQLPFLCFFAPSGPEFGGNEYGRVYEPAPGGCKECSRDRTQVADLILKLPAGFKKEVSMSFDWELIVSARVRSEIEDAGLRGMSFRSIRNRKGGIIADFWQLTPGALMPPLSAASWEVEGVCPGCGRDNIYLRSPMRYRAEELPVDVDFARMAEQLGRDGGRYNFVSKRAYRILKKYAKKRENWQGILLVD